MTGTTHQQVDARNVSRYCAVRDRMNDHLRKVIEAKEEARRMQQQLSFTEKIKLLEKLRDRSLAIARSPLGRRYRTTSRAALIGKDRHAPSRD